MFISLVKDGVLTRLFFLKKNTINTEMFAPIVAETKGLKLKSRQIWFVLKPLKENILYDSCNFCSVGLWTPFFLCIHIIWDGLCNQVFPFLMDVNPIRLGLTLLTTSLLDQSTNTISKLSHLILIKN